MSNSCAYNVSPLARGGGQRDKPSLTEKPALIIKVREALDARDGFTSKRRAEMYELFPSSPAIPP